MQNIYCVKTGAFVSYNDDGVFSACDIYISPYWANMLIVKSNKNGLTLNTQDKLGIMYVRHNGGVLVNSSDESSACTDTVIVSTVATAMNNRLYQDITRNITRYDKTGVLGRYMTKIKITDRPKKEEYNG